MILDVQSINTFYGTSHILHGVSLSIYQAEAIALLGRNGMGKTTTLRSIIGLTPPKSGTIYFNGEIITGVPPYKIFRMGIAYVPDDLRIFPDLTCQENLEISARMSKRKGFWDRKKVEELFPVLGARRKQKGINLSGGEKKMLAIGRALMANPLLILLDEPSEGLAPLILKALMDSIEEIKKGNITLLMADQNLKFCHKVSERGYIIEKGCIVYEGETEDIWQNEEIIRKYLAV